MLKGSSQIFNSIIVQQICPPSSSSLSLQACISGLHRATYSHQPADWPVLSHVHSQPPACRLASSEPRSLTATSLQTGQFWATFTHNHQPADWPVLSHVHSQPPACRLASSEPCWLTALVNVSSSRTVFIQVIRGWPGKIRKHSNLISKLKYIKSMQ